VKALDIVADTNNHNLPRFRRLIQFSRNGQVGQRRNMQFFPFAGTIARIECLGEIFIGTLAPARLFIQTDIKDGLGHHFVREK
jgi:hypothetical protein